MEKEDLCMYYTISNFWPFKDTQEEEEPFVIPLKSLSHN